MNRQRFLITLILGASIAWAEGGDSGVALKSVGGSGGEIRMMFGGPSFGPPTVVGAPYSAEVAREGARIQSSMTALYVPLLIYRDSQGRTRTERSAKRQATSDADQRFRIVQIVDPVARCHYVLDPEQKIAHRVKIREFPFEPPAGADETVVALAPSPVELAGPSTSPRVDISTEPLGTQSIGGIQADGRRHIVTLPAGAQENNEPVVTTYDTWIARDLKIVILTRRTDARAGEKITRLTHISRAEPNPALFAPPVGYKIVDEEGEFTIAMMRP